METSYLEAAKPELEKYDVLTKQIKAAIKTRKELQAEKKATPILNVLKHRELTSRIEDLTEQLEDLRSERAIILMYLDCEESRDTAEVKKRCTAAETMLKSSKSARQSILMRWMMQKTLLPTYRNRQKIWTQESYMKQGWLFATRKNRTLFSNCKRRMENSLLLLQCFMAGVMLKKFSMKEPNRRSLFRKKNAIVKQWLKIRRGKYPNAMK